MKRLSNNERLSFILALVIVVAGVIGAAIGIDLLYRICILCLGGLVFFYLSLIIFRLERTTSQQKKTRREIYQVLYSLHGTEKLTVQQLEETRALSVEEAVKTRRYLLRNLKGESNESTEKLLQRTNKKIDAAAEAQRLQANRMFSVLDAHWEYFSEK